jgi:hypothetical protein
MHTLQHFVQTANISLVIGCVALSSLAQAAPRREAIVIDHHCININRVPLKYVEQAKAELRLAYGHTSHGSQLVSGMEALRRDKPKIFAFGRQSQGLSLIDRTPKGDLGNPDRTSWAQSTREFLKGAGKDRNVIMWSWCGQVSNATPQDIETYLSLMNGLEKEFPGVTFVYMTGHLDGSGKNGNLHQRNEQIRAFCRQNNKVLFDFADIESYDPDGKVNYMELNARDTCDYKRGRDSRNWAQDWIAANPQHLFSLPDSAAHTHPLNGAMKGNAFWWMMARLAGWSAKTR